jgi:DNA-binding NtrC family response regulator
MRSGGYNYILKPVSLARLTEVCLSFFSNRPVRRIKDARFSRFITTSPLFEGVFKKISAFAEIDSPVLICGETGTGKELVAMQLHALSKRWNKKFTPINIAAISPGLFESSLFGHKRGSFTGAHRDHQGYLEQAAEGTIFLDEIGELGLDEQKKLLRVFQNRVFSAVGSTVELPLTA